MTLDNARYPGQNIHATNYRLKLSCFGINEYQDGRELDPSIYLAPEVKRHPINVSKASDVYSIGVILLQLWFRSTDCLFKEQYGRLHFKLPTDTKVAEKIEQCLKLNPRDRLVV
ncbi:uncharacterized protein LOC128214542 [Mya arenaria]|uniref:uncharacterized protein LOC128214542 n=1 Tax=Mya arenaria TaxID=6604 RepID=UPI0022E31035|nr:uncharacterized protein LOC128214542 [Mya arenaria]